MSPDPSATSQMRIAVAPDGNVEFSVSLTDSVDPSVVASMVAAVRAGIVAKQPPDPPTPEPTSDPDGADPRPDRAPSPLVAVPPRKLSVRQLAAQLEGSEGRRSSAQHLRYSGTAPDPAEYDPVREFSSSPALWLTARPDAYIDPYDNAHAPKHGMSDRVKRTSSGRREQNKESVRISRPLTVDRVIEPDLAPPVVAKPVRMLSLPSGVSYDPLGDTTCRSFDDESGSSHAATELDSKSKVGGFSRLAAAMDDDLGPSTGEQTPELTDDRVCTPADRVRARRDRALKMREAVKRSSSDLEEPEFRDAVGEIDRADDVPSSPYVQQSGGEDEHDDAWDNVEYVLTESYRQDPKSSEVKDTKIERGRPYGRSGPWRFFWAFSNSFSRRRIEIEEDVHQSTLAPAGRSQKTLGEGTTAKRNRGMFGRHNKAGGLWLEFSSSLPVERMLAEIGKVSKQMGYQVWRRAGENKLRCIRQLSQRAEMHMVILVGSVKLPDGAITVVKLTRARSDRNRTEAWRYSHFYRELIERLQRSGIDISSEL